MKSQKRILLNIRPEMFISLFLVITLLAVYLQVRDHSFIIFDDNVYVTENPQVQSGINLDTVKWAFSLKETKPMYWHPLTWISHMLDVKMYGFIPGKHHIVNLIFHIVNSIILFDVFRRMSGEIWKSAVVALLFAIHPMNVESVAWIAARKNVLSTFFWMVTIIFYAKYTQRLDIKWYLSALAVFSLGLMAKQMLITLPFVLLLLDFWPLKRFQIKVGRATNERENSKIMHPNDTEASLLFVILEKVPFFLIALLAIYIASVSMQQSNIFISFESIPLSLRCENALISYSVYIFKAIWPANLAVFYPFPKMIELWKLMGACFLLICISIAVIYFIHKMPYLFVGWFWFLGTLLPVAGFVQAGIWPAMADRWAYVPLIGIFIILAWMVPDLFMKEKRKKVGFTLALFMVIMLLMFKTWHQTRHWVNSFTIFKHTVEVTHDNSVAHNNLGSLYAMNGMIKRATEHFSKAFKIDPESISAGNNLGRALVITGSIREGIAQYENVLKVHPNNIPAIKNLAFAYSSTKEYKTALLYFKRWEDLQTNNPEPCYHIAKIYAGRNNVNESIMWLKKAIENGYDIEFIRQDESFRNIRENEYFKKLANEYKK